MPAWKNITLDIPKGDLNSISEKISEIKRVLSITITDKIDEPNSKWFDEDGKQKSLLGETHLIKLLTSASINSDLLNDDIRKKLEDETINILEEEIFEDRDWIQYSKNQFKEINITDTLRILPPWITNKNNNGISIIIEPGSGFGTGSHSTTQLCLKWIEKNISSDSNFLDYGCGSGILSIAANKFGCKQVIGIDNDYQALINAHKNKKLNAANVKFLKSEDFNPKIKFDIVVANILLNSIIKLRKKLIQNLKPGGDIVLSGILKKQHVDIVKCFEKDILIYDILQDDEWLLIHGKNIKE